MTGMCNNPGVVWANRILTEFRVGNGAKFDVARGQNRRRPTPVEDGRERPDGPRVKSLASDFAHPTRVPIWGRLGNGVAA
jgi:hypothetical protein